jgi:hypothetical protein
MSELSDTNYISYIQLKDNETIELVSYNTYGTEDYWDLLLLINNRDPLFGMCYDYDMIYDRSVDYVNTFFSATYSGIVSTALTAEFVAEELATRLTRNESLRTFKLIKPSMLQPFLKSARDKGYI